jgi:uncharacterized membrane protein
MCKENITNLERVGSVAAGSALIASGIVNLFSKPSKSVIKMLAGGLLIWRGGSGFCPVNALLGIDRTKVEEPEPLRSYYPEYPNEDDNPQASEQYL